MKWKTMGTTEPVKDQRDRITDHTDRTQKMLNVM